MGLGGRAGRIVSYVTHRSDASDSQRSERAGIIILLKMIFNFKKTTPALPPRRLADLAPGQIAVIAELALPPAASEPLMDLGLVAGSRVLAVRRAPGGDPVVYRVDGAEIALRRETTRHISILPVDEAAEVCP